MRGRKIKAVSVVGGTILCSCPQFNTSEKDPTLVPLHFGGFRSQAETSKVTPSLGLDGE